MVNEMGLEGTFIFAGHTDDIPQAYRSGDVIALSSITEAFPYSVVEAMMTGKPVVATDVGGIREALGETGMLVRPQQPEELAHSITTLLENPQIRHTLGEEARQRALNYFTIERVLGLYLDSYKQRLLSEKGYALMAFGLWKEAIGQFKQAVDEVTESPAVPVIITEIAHAYNNLGEYDKAFNELEKAEALTILLQTKKTA
jgi:hypothetical protein